jgi:hypothetical protein
MQSSLGPNKPCCMQQVQLHRGSASRLATQRTARLSLGHAQLWVAARGMIMLRQLTLQGMIALNYFCSSDSDWRLIRGLIMTSSILKLTTTTCVASELLMGHATRFLCHFYSLTWRDFSNSGVACGSSRVLCARWLEELSKYFKNILSHYDSVLMEQCARPQ